MPKILTYERKATLTTQGVAPKISGVDPVAEGLKGIGVSLFGVGERAKTEMNRVAERLRIANINQEFSKANIEGARAREEIEMKYFEDIDFSTIPERAEKDLRDAGSQILKNIKTGEAKNKFQLDFEYKNIFSLGRIKKNATSRFAAYDLELMEQELANAKKRVFTATPGIEKQNARDEISVIVSRRIGVALTKPEAANRVRLEMDNLIEGQITHDIENNTEFALEELQKGKEGIYKNADAELRLRKEREAIQKINRDEAQAKKNQSIQLSKGETDFGNNLLNSGITVTEDEVNMAEVKGLMGLEGGISKEFATVARRAIKSINTITPKLQPTVFNKLQDDVVRLGLTKERVKGKDIYSTTASVEDIAKFRAEVMNAWGKGEIGTAVAQNWLKAGSFIFDDLLGIETEARLAKEHPKTFWERITFWSDEYAEDREETKARLGAELMDRYLNTDESGKDITNDIIKKEQKRVNPLIGNADEEGTLMIDAFGNKAIVYPDGRIKEVD